MTDCYNGGEMKKLILQRLKPGRCGYEIEPLMPSLLKEGRAEGEGRIFRENREKHACNPRRSIRESTLRYMGVMGGHIKRREDEGILPYGCTNESGCKIKQTGCRGRHPLRCTNVMSAKREDVDILPTEHCLRALLFFTFLLYSRLPRARHGARPPRHPPVTVQSPLSPRRPHKRLLFPFPFSHLR